MYKRTPSYRVLFPKIDKFIIFLISNLSTKIRKALTFLQYPLDVFLFQCIALKIHEFEYCFSYNLIFDFLFTTFVLFIVPHPHANLVEISFLYIYKLIYDGQCVSIMGVDFTHKYNNSCAIHFAKCLIEITHKTTYSFHYYIRFTMVLDNKQQFAVLCIYIAYTIQP